MTPDSDPDRDNKCTETTDCPVGGATPATAGSHTPVVTSGSPTTRCNSICPQHPYIILARTISSPTGCLVEVMDILNRSMTNQYAILQETLRQSQSVSKEHFVSNAKPCDGKNLQTFGIWLDEVSMTNHYLQ